MGSIKTKGWHWSVADASNPTLVMVVDDTSKAVHIADASDRNTDWNVSADSNPAVYIHSATNPATEYLKLYHDATDAYIDGVGATGLKLAIAGTAEVTLNATSLSPTTSDGNALGTASLMWSDLFLASGAVVNFNNGDVTLTHASNTLTVGGGDLLVANGQGVIIGHTAQITGNAASELQVLGTALADGSAILGVSVASAVGPELMFVKSRNAAIGSHTIVNDNDEIGKIVWLPDDGVDFATEAAVFQAEVDDASPAAGDVGMAFVWEQMPGGAGAIAETMRISAAGIVNIAKGDIKFDSSVDSAAVADQVAIGGYEIGAGNRVLAISQETTVAADTDETKFSHKMQARINGADYYIMLTQT